MSKADIGFAIWASIGTVVLFGTFLVGAYLDGKKNKEFEFDNWSGTGLMLAIFWPLLPVLPISMLLHFCIVRPIEWLCKKANQAGRMAVMDPLNQHPTAKPDEMADPFCYCQRSARKPINEKEAEKEKA